MRFKNLLVSGCSFTQDGIGGTPPTENSPGGCSFIKDIEFNAADPKSWAGFLAQRLEVTSMVNTAGINHGNVLVANSILECINRFQYRPDNTIIVLNIALPSRFDLICGHNHSSADNSVSWNESIIPYSFMSRSRSKLKQTLPRYLEQNIGAEYIEYISANYIDLLFNFLENKGFRYYFLTTMNDGNSHLQKVLAKFSSNFISLTPGGNIVDFCINTNNRLSESDFHPTLTGHKEIANQVYQHILENEIHLPVL